MNALIVIDMQYDFINPQGKLYIKNSECLIEPINKLIKEYRNNNQIVIFTKDSHPKGHISFRQWGEHCLKNSVGEEIVLDIFEDDYVIKKGINKRSDSYSGWYIDKNIKSELENILVEHCIDQIEIVGVATNVCVIATYNDLIKNNYKTTINYHLTKEINSSL